MATKQSSNNRYLLVGIDYNQQSKLTGRPYWRLTFMQVNDDYTTELFHCDVDESMQNYKKSGWQNILSKSNPLAVYDGLRLTKRTSSDGLPVITADSKPQAVIDNIDMDELQSIYDLIDKKQAFLKQTNYQRLFQTV